MPTLTSIRPIEFLQHNLCYITDSYPRPHKQQGQPHRRRNPADGDALPSTVENSAERLLKVGKLGYLELLGETGSGLDLNILLEEPKLSV